MSAELAIATHLRLSSEAIEGATDLQPDNHFSAYLAQQAVEQLALALALAERIHVPRSQHHQLDWMIKQRPETNAARPALSALTWLEIYATTYRYPSPSGRMPETADREKVAGALAATRTVLEMLAAHFGVDLDRKSRTPASHAMPPRTP